MKVDIAQLLEELDKQKLLIRSLRILPKEIAAGVSFLYTVYLPRGYIIESITDKANRAIL